MTTNTTVAAIKAMQTVECNFTSSGAGRVTIVALPHDKDTIQFVVAGEPVFSITYVGFIGTFEWAGFSGLNVNQESRLAAIDALNFMFESLKIKAQAAEYKGQVSCSGNDIIDSKVRKEFKLIDLHLILDECRERPKLSM